MKPPSTNPVTLPFNATDAPYSAANPHLGTDFSFLPDPYVYAPFTGVVLTVANNGRDGNGTYMTDEDGRFHGLLHQQEFLVPNKALVQMGQRIGIMGETGVDPVTGQKTTFGRHCHWAVKVSGTFINPMTLVKEINMADLHPYNKGDAQNVAERIGHTTEELASKVDWNDVWYQVLDGYIRSLQQRIADLEKQPAGSVSTADPDGQKWRDYKTLTKELNS